MSALSDVQRAVFTQWNSAGLSSTILGGLHLDQLPKATAALPSLPYAIFTVQQEKPNKWALRTYTAYTRVTFEVYDTNVTGSSISAIHAAFDWSNALTGVNNKLDFSFTNAAHLYTELGTEDEKVTPLERNGQRIRRGITNFIIWTQRFGG